MDISVIDATKTTTEKGITYGFGYSLHMSDKKRQRFRLFF